MSHPEPNPHRLPKNVVPLHYYLTLTPDIAAETFEGYEAVTIDVREPTREITLNQVGISLSGGARVEADGRVRGAKEIRRDDARERLTLVFDDPIPVGKARLSFPFSGSFTEGLRGLYASEYGLADGRKRRMATTQFEATDARRVFPCWDEPDFKATFRVLLYIPRELTAISNTPVAEEWLYPPRDLKGVSFATTPKMSTYLLAFLVGEFENIEAETAHGVTVRVLTMPGKSAQGRFALDVACRTLDYLTDYFGIPYPLPKLDLIAVPDFAAGAMENWGAVTFRETALLVDEAQSAETARQRVAEVVAHELSHQWFGNLVTMEWWTDLWLNEGFASWMGDKVVDALFPEWDHWTRFVSQDTNDALALDGLRNTHPIEVPVNDPKEIREIFDAISYSKGASVIRMLESYLGEEAFRKGLREYLGHHAYGNARTDDLWQALEFTSQKPVRTLMDAWTRRPGYPLVTVVYREAPKGVVIGLHQSHFLYEGDAGSAGEETPPWPIPISTESSVSDVLGFELLMTERTKAVTLSGEGVDFDSFWLKTNADQVGFYRVNYDPEGWARLIPRIEAMQLEPRDRLGLQSDAYALQRAGHLPAAQFLEIAAVYRNETSYAVLSDLAEHVAGFNSLLAGEPCHEAFREFARGLFSGAVERAGWDRREGEKHTDAMLRSLVLGAAGGYGNPAIIAEAKKRFAMFLADGALDPNLRGVVYGLVAQHGTEAEYESLLSLWRAASLQEEKVRLLQALGAFRSRELCERTLEFSLSEEVRSQDVVYGISGVAANLAVKGLAWEFLKTNWPRLKERLGGSLFLLGRIIEMTTAGFATAEHENDVRVFFEGHDVPEAKRTIAQSLERIRLNAKWLERNREDLVKWFAAARG